MPQRLNPLLAIVFNTVTYFHVNIGMRTLLTFLLFIYMLPLHAQRFRAELVGGIVGSQISGDQLSGFNKIGCIAGAGIRTRLSEKSSAGFRLLYLQKGSRKPDNLEKGDPTLYRLRLNYIELPLTYRYTFRKGFYAEAGPSLGYLAGWDEEDENGDLYQPKPFLDFDLSAHAVFGYPLGKGWDVQITGWQSIVPVRNHSGNTTYRLNRGQYSQVLGLVLLHTFQSDASDTE